MGIMRTHENNWPEIEADACIPHEIIQQVARQALVGREPCIDLPRNIPFRGTASEVVNGPRARPTSGMINGRSLQQHEAHTTQVERTGKIRQAKWWLSYCLRTEERNRLHIAEQAVLRAEFDLHYDFETGAAKPPRD